MGTKAKPKRIVGQCNRADFASIAHLSVTLKEPEMLDTTTLTNRQKFAFHFLAIAQDKKIPWKLLRRVVQEVLFWGDDLSVDHLEIKFVRGLENTKEVAEFKKFW